MESTGLPPNKVILTTLLKVYVRGGLFEKSRELLAALQAKGYAEDELYRTSTVVQTRFQGNGCALDTERMKSHQRIWVIMKALKSEEVKSQGRVGTCW
ncbi:uncharacterized protein LOC133817583 isoform X2 [Humulus lupulus]|uniref:uncharacterized protein LOC133817583 isoform X2 n=1 Tax=Humulus lupulus TaxID=3486 RepID=UPI002B40C45E|nr:uncharacterized protein LOC133817583 isoform X2 [Humulus lupulus]